MENLIYEITLNKDKRIIPELASFVSSSAGKLGLSCKKVNFLCFTIETVLEYRTNALDENNQEIKIDVYDKGSSFVFSVTDYGPPYILSENQIKILNRKLVDKYTFEQRGRRGQCFSFVYKYDSLLQPEVKEVIKEELLDESFRFELLEKRDEEILEAIKCLYDVYGYDYYHQHLYSVEQFKKYCQNGRYVPIIGKNMHNQVVSYCALDENTWFEGVPELSNLVTKKFARGKGIASAIFAKSEEVARTLQYEGVHVIAVAHHPYTQIMANKLGYTPSAIEYSINPKGTDGNKEERRLDCVVGVKIFDKNKIHNLYIDKKTNALLKKIFEDEKLSYKVINEVDRDSKESDYSYAVDTDTSNCFFKIEECSKDFESEMRKLEENPEIKNTEVITINLNMNHPSSIWGYRCLRNLGYICTGCIPGSKHGDYMLLQKFKVQPIYEKIVLESNYQELAKMIYELNEIKGNVEI